MIQRFHMTSVWSQQVRSFKQAFTTKHGFNLMPTHLNCCFQAVCQGIFRWLKEQQRRWWRGRLCSVRSVFSHKGVTVFSHRNERAMVYFGFWSKCKEIIWHRKCKINSNNIFLKWLCFAYSIYRKCGFSLAVQCSEFFVVRNFKATQCSFYTFWNDGFKINFWSID